MVGDAPSTAFMSPKNVYEADILLAIFFAAPIFGIGRNLIRDLQRTTGIRMEIKYWILCHISNIILAHTGMEVHQWTS